MEPYYYSKMNKIQQSAYHAMLQGIQALADSIQIPKLPAEDIYDVFFRLRLDHPEIFWATSYQYKYYQDSPNIIFIPEYLFDKAKVKEHQKAMQSRVEKLVRPAKTLSEWEKEKYVHDELIKLVDYHEGTDMNQSAYSALVEGRSVCAGYARAFQYILKELEIPCYYCTGYSGEEHAWNIVKLDDGYYNVDVTWDDTDPSTCDYFNKTDADYAKTHLRRDLSVYLPVCNADDYRKGGAPAFDLGDAETDGEIVASGNTDVDELINDNPQKPLTWEDTKDEMQKAREELGLTEDEVMDTLDKYYADCLKQMKKVGSGKQQFTTIIPKSLWPTIEEEYSDGGYKKGYVNESLKELKMEEFAIQLQTERINNYFYRLHHNVSTWNE